MKNSKFVAVLMCALALVFAVSGSAFVVSAAPAALPETTSPSAILLEANSGTVLFENNAHEHRPVASMVKIMTLTLAFDALERGEIALDENISVSEKASSMGGSQAFLDAHAEYRAEELLKAIIVASANDACVAIAERLSGSVDGFVAEMNDRAATLGMNDTNFVNCTGLPAANQYSCAHDAGLMFRDLIRHEKYFEFSKIWMFDFEHPSGRKTMLSNTNKLIRAYEGCDGGKTGFTNEAMYCLSATAMRGGLRLISVVTGAETSKSRNAEICRLFDYGFANFESKQVLFKNVPLDRKLTFPTAKEKESAVVPASDGFVLTEKGEGVETTYRTEFYDGLRLPLAAGSAVGKIYACAGDAVVAESELVTVSDLTERGYFDIVGEMIDKW